MIVESNPRFAINGNEIHMVRTLFDREVSKHFTNYCKGIIDDSGMATYEKAVIVELDCKYCSFRTIYSEDLWEHKCSDLSENERVFNMYKRTNLPIWACKRALIECDWNELKAKSLLIENSIYGTITAR